MKAAGSAMVGQVPGKILCSVRHSSRAEKIAEGLLKFDCAPPLPLTAQRAKGYDLGLVAVLEKPEDVSVYAEHPAHQK